MEKLGNKQKLLKEQLKAVASIKPKIVNSSKNLTVPIFTYDGILGIGRVFGVCPMHWIRQEKSYVLIANFEWLSLPVLYSLVVLIIALFFSINISADYVQLAAHSVTSVSTDIFALSIFLSIYFSTRLISYIFCVFKTKSLTVLFNFAKNYDEIYKIRKNTTVLTVSGWFLIIGVLCGLLGNVIVSKEIISNLTCQALQLKSNFSESVFYKYPVLHLFSSPMAVIIFNAFGHFMGEMSLLFTIMTVSFYTRVIIDRLDIFANQAEEHFSYKEWFFWKVSPNLQSGRKKHNLSANDPDFVKFLTHQFEMMIELSNKLRNYYQDTLLMYTTSTLILMIMGVYLLIVNVKLSVDSLDDGKIQFYKVLVDSKENFALFMCLWYAIFKMMVLVNLGENLTAAVSDKYLL